MRTERHNGDHVFGLLADEWDALVQQSMTNTPFQRLAYQRAWWQHCGPSNGNLHTVTVREGDGRLMAIACFYNIDGVLYFNGCTQETDYLDVLVAEDKATAAWTAVLDCLASPDFPEWHALDLCNVPAASLTRQILPQEAAQRGFLHEESVHEVCPVITLNTTFEGYLENIDSKQRRELQRKLRRADAADAVLHLISQDEDVTQAVDDFLELLQKSTFEKRDWLTDGRRALFHDVARAAHQDGYLQLLFMEVDGRKAATLLNFDYNNRIWVYNSGLDPVNFSNLSLGVVITAKAIEYAADHGRATFDFLRGNETYKYRFGAQDTVIYRQQISKR
ncbi:MAG TPA: GNAT family N-acetyltransferase [Chloroflexota bacterium]|nr:GNAT family N-acetyltransferase [Chloroflexota bacterium]